MKAVYLHSALCYHVPGNGTVYPARKEQQALARGAYGHTVGAPDKFIEYKRFTVFANVDIDDKIRRMHVDFEPLVGVKQSAAYSRAYLGRLERKSFIGAVSFHFERPFVVAYLRSGGKDLVHIGIHLKTNAQRMYAEHLAQLFNNFIHVARIKIFDEVSAAETPDLVPDTAQRLFHIGNKHALEIAAVLALQMYFRIADNDHMFHIFNW